MKISQRLWTEYFSDLATPDRVWLCMWGNYRLSIVHQAFDEIAKWRKRKPHAQMLDVAKMITARCRLLDLGERPVRELNVREPEMSTQMPDTEYDGVSLAESSGKDRECLQI